MWCNMNRYAMWLFVLVICGLRPFVGIRGTSTFSILGTYEAIAHILCGMLLTMWLMRNESPTFKGYWTGLQAGYLLILLTIVEIVMFIVNNGRSL